MSRETVPVTVQIMDSDYRVSCPEAEREALLEAGRYLDEKMREIRDSGKAFGVERIAVIAALNVSYELLRCKADMAEWDAFTSRRLEELQAKIEIALRKSAEIEV